VLTPFTTTGIGSLPHRDPEEACRLVLDTCDIPFWPQLPNMSFKESMIPQYSEGLPCIKVDEQRESIWIEKDNSDELMKFYETCSEDCAVAISQEYAKGLYAFLKTINKKQFQVLKGHVTGPLTFTLGLKDSEKRLVYFDEELREICLMLLKAKIRWQVEVLKSYAGSVIIFIDEPILSALGSTSYLGVDPHESLRLLRETSDAIEHAEGIPGIHCCSNADWPLVINSNVRIINFDAYEYIETIMIYPEEFKQFLQGGGYLAWGIVPTTDSIKDVNLDLIKRHFESGIERLSKLVPSTLLLSQILLTPSCGAGSRSIEEAVKVFQTLRALKESMV
jgi:methionine synthase II (cobalamin-independent)